MTTCPRCGRVADDEFVCGECGAFLASEDDQPPGEVSLRRVTVLALLVCLAGVGAAAVLLHQGGGGQTDGVAPPLGGASLPLSSVPLGLPGSTFPDDSSGTLPLPSTSLTTATPTTSSAGPSVTDTTSPHASRSAHPTSTAPTSTAPTTAPRPSRSTTPSPQPSSTRPTTTQPPRSTPPTSTPPPPPPPPPPPTVELARGTACGQHCYTLDVTARNFSPGQHTVSCWSDRGQFDSYTTSAPTSSGCPYNHPHVTVWVFVDGRKSNTVSW